MADPVLSMADLFLSMADLAFSMADLVLSRADLAFSRADPVLSRADLVISRADRVDSRADGVDSRGRRVIFADDVARPAGMAVCWGEAGFTPTAAAALLRRNGEDGVPAGVLSPLRKTAKHNLAGVLLTRRNARAARQPNGEEPGLRRGERPP